MAEADQRAESITADGTHSRGEDAMMMFAREGLDKKVVLTTDANGEKHLPSLSGEAIDEKNAMPRVMKALKPMDTGGDHTWPRRDGPLGEFPATGAMVASQVGHLRNISESDSGLHYEGGFLGGDVKFGPGTLQSENGDRYTGEFLNGARHGRGILISAQDERYEGEFKAGIKHGEGMIVLPTGERYTGTFANNLRYGKGSATYADGSTYEGGWLADRHHGQGTHVTMSGTKYVGQWAGGFKSGAGHVVFCNGSKYLGQWDRDCFHGEGTLYYPDGTDAPAADAETNKPYKYTGHWAANKRHGQGTLLMHPYKEGSQPFKADPVVISGDWDNDKATGESLLIFADGREYNGDVYEGEACGDGEMSVPTKFGTGTLSDPVVDATDVYTGQWKNGHLVSPQSAFKRFFRLFDFSPIRSLSALSSPRFRLAKVKCCGRTTTRTKASSTGAIAVVPASLST